jgi:arginine exporter protein ArgO
VVITHVGVYGVSALHPVALIVNAVLVALGAALLTHVTMSARATVARQEARVQASA